MRSASAIADLASAALPKSRQLLFMVGTGDNPAVAAESVRRLKEQHPSAFVVVLSDSFESTGVVSALRAGANGYILKTISCEALIKSLDLVLLGEIVLPSEFLRMVYDSGDAQVAAAPVPMLTNGGEVAVRESAAFDPTLRKLSSRESVILRCLMLGDANKSIARQLGIADATVKVHIKAILRKIGVTNRTQAALWAVKHLPHSTGVTINGGHTYAGNTPH